MKTEGKFSSEMLLKGFKIYGKDPTNNGSTGST